MNSFCELQTSFTEIARVDKLNWQKDSNDILNTSEKMMVDFLFKAAAKEKQTLLAVEYSLDIAAMPHFYTRYLNNE